MSEGKWSVETVQYLSFPVHSNDTSSWLVGGSDKNGLTADPVHVDTSPSLQVIQVDVAIFGDEKDNILLGTDLNVQKEKDHHQSVLKQDVELKATRAHEGRCSG